MVGNDVVDLGDPEAQPETRHPRFDGRVFTVRELRLIDRHRNSNHMRWVLWACKESAYKLVKRNHPSTVFSQRSFVVDLVSPETALVRHQKSMISIEISQRESAIHAIATWWGVDSGLVISAVGATTADPSEAVRALARERLAGALDLPPAEIEFASDPHRIPTLMIGGRQAPDSISFSHHGRYVAFACCLSPDATAVLPSTSVRHES